MEPRSPAAVASASTTTSSVRSGRQEACDRLIGNARARTGPASVRAVTQLTPSVSQRIGRSRRSRSARFSSTASGARRKTTPLQDPPRSSATDSGPFRGSATNPHRSSAEDLRHPETVPQSLLDMLEAGISDQRPIGEDPDVTGMRRARQHFRRPHRHIPHPSAGQPDRQAFRRRHGVAAQRASSSVRRICLCAIRVPPTICGTPARSFRADAFRRTCGRTWPSA